MAKMYNYNLSILNFYAIYGNMSLMVNVTETEEYSEWFDSLTAKEQAIVSGRILRIKEFDHYGVTKKVGTVHELKFKSGMRIYYGLARDRDGKIVILLMGGNKNGQSKDIKKAEKIFSRLTSA